MRITALVSAAALALSVGMGTAKAADQFSTLERVQAETLSQPEMTRIHGAFVLLVDPDGDGIFLLLNGDVNGEAPCPTIMGCLAPGTYDFVSPAIPPGTVTCFEDQCFAPH